MSFYSPLKQDNLYQSPRAKLQYTLGKQKMPVQMAGPSPSVFVSPSNVIHNQGIYLGNETYTHLPGQSRVAGHQTLPHHSYSRVVEGSIPVQTVHTANLYQNIKGYKQKKQTESRITYHPYQRTYIDYEEQIVLVPVEKIRIKYYQKIIETQFVRTPIQQVITQTVMVQKDVMRVQYIPVEQQIIHFPTSEKQYVRTEHQQSLVHAPSSLVQMGSGVQRQQVNGGSQIQNVIIFNKQNQQPNNAPVSRQNVVSFSHVSHDKEGVQVSSGSQVKQESNMIVQSRPISMIHQESKHSIKQMSYHMPNQLDESQVNQRYQHWQ